MADKREESCSDLHGNAVLVGVYPLVYRGSPCPRPAPSTTIAIFVSPTLSVPAG